MKRLFVAILAAVVSTLANAQQNTPSADVYGRANSMAIGTVYEGTVIDVRRVRIEPTGTTTWTARSTAAALGGLLGSSVKGRDNVRVAGGIIGGVLGGVAGDYAADRFGSDQGQEILIALKDGRAVAITQSGASPFAPGTPVYVIQSGGTSRVVYRANASTSAPAAPAVTYAN
jgi:outer membrane lipoprotein SlyB